MFRSANSSDSGKDQRMVSVITSVVADASVLHWSNVSSPCQYHNMPMFRSLMTSADWLLLHVGRTEVKNVEQGHQQIAQCNAATLGLKTCETKAKNNLR